MPARRLLFLGDVVGEPGRKALIATLPSLREKHAPDLVVANAENVAGGLGVTEKTARALLDAGIDVLTTGNHVYRHRDVYRFLDSCERIVRPANFLETNPGRGHTVLERDGVRWGIVNLMGTVYMDVARSPFHEANRLLHALKGDADLVVVDFHAEVTSEKVAMGWHLDGRALAVIGTHTHVPTADARVLPAGTAYITAVGTAGEDVWIMGCLVESAESGLAQSIELVMEPAA